jgi:hypothetical protein
LNESLGAFDAKLRKEQEKIARERDARPATAATVAASDSSPEPGAVRAGDLKSERIPGAGGNASGNGAVASEIPDGSDDDVVARRLRRAAQEETDPELKEKLWKEYVEYRKSAVGGR